MAQADGIVSNASGAAVRADLNNQLAAVFTNHSGATEPSTTYAYQWWADTTTGLLKIRNATNTAWVTVGTLASANLGAAQLSGASFTGNVSTTGTLTDAKGDVRDIPQNSQTSAYILVADDAGKHISITTGGVTVPTAVFGIGDAITIYNNSSSNQTITQGASTTLRQAGTANTGNRTLAQYGVATVLCVASNTFVISGAGLT